jgi:hypothetical protein
VIAAAQFLGANLKLALKRCDAILQGVDQGVVAKTVTRAIIVAVAVVRSLGRTVRSRVRSIVRSSVRTVGSRVGSFEQHVHVAIDPGAIERAALDAHPRGLRRDA